ncbi:hypothetical protein A3709_02390 [Halioglobus sp. HI00S01]|uniref:DUF7933 domain-containing protein n=1 Tax=Halioglobus sp. HI00S01 TaxID=1822214 RepID=UPI0007C2227A|nr:SdrD B-like domain-containing protein [Halioglobus sp. HI00S01]KZX58331.1 hypothetical protein A3709_02390 [Halioglobus sp. HI00S01]
MNSLLNACTHQAREHVKTSLRQGFFKLTKLMCGLVVMAVSMTVSAQVTNPNFSVSVNAGLNAPNSTLVYPGEKTSLRVTLSNGSTITEITGVNFSNSLPTSALSGLLVDGEAEISGPGCTSGTLTTLPGEPGISLSNLTVPVRQEGVAGSGECYLDIPIVAYSADGESTTLAYSLLAGTVNSDLGDNETGGGQGFTLRSTVAPEWSKGFVGKKPGNTLIVGGSSSTLRFTLHNRDPNISLTNIRFTDIFPVAGSAGAIIEPTGAVASGSCGGSVGLTTGADARVTVSGVDLTPNSSCTIDVAVQARHSNGVHTVSRTNVVASDAFISAEGLRPVNNASTKVRARSPLAVDKRFRPDVVASGEPNTLRITFTNSGTDDLPVTSFTDSPIAAEPFVGHLSIAAATDISNSCGGIASLVDAGNGFSLSGFSIPGGGKCTVDVTYSGITPSDDTPTTYTNAIPEGAVQTIAGVVSQARSATVLVADRLRVLKSVAADDAAPGDPVNYMIEVQNYSTSSLTNVDVTDRLQNGSTLLLDEGFAPSLSGECGELNLNGAVTGQTSLTFTISSIPGRSSLANTPGSCEISFWVMLDPDGNGNTQNEIAAGDVCYGTSPRICNNVGSGSIGVMPVQTMTLVKQFDGEDSLSLNEGTPARMSFTVSNRSITNLINLTLSDTFPSAGPFQQLRVADPMNLTNTCGGDITVSAGSTSFALNGGSVPARDGNSPGTCSVAIDTVGPAGSYSNTVNGSAVRQNANGSTSVLNESDSATLTYIDALSVNKYFLLESVGSGGRSTVSIELASFDDARPITGISLTDDLPTGMVVADPDNSYTTCSGPTIIDAVPFNSSVSFSGATLAPLASCELRFDVIATGNASWVNEIPPGGVTADGGLLNRNPVSATLNYIPLEFPLISKSISPGTVVPGESALLTISITNADQNLTNVEVTDYFSLDGTIGALPNGMKLAPAPEASTDCPGGIVAAVPGSDRLGLSGASLGANASCIVQARVISTTVGAIINTIPESSMISDQGATNASSFAQSTLSTTSDAGVSKTFTPSVVGPYEVSTLRITIFNARAESITAMELVDDLPVGVFIADEPNAFSNCGGSAVVDFPSEESVRLQGGAIGPAQGDEAAYCYVEVDVFSISENSYLNVIEADALTSNGVPIPHPEATANLEVRQRLIVNKAFDDLTLDAGDPVEFTTGVASRLPGENALMTIRIENPNTGTLTQVNLIDSLPDGLVLAESPDIATDCLEGVLIGVPAGRELRLIGATLPPTGEPGAVCTITAGVVSNIPGTYTNEIAAGDVTSLEGIDNLPGTQAQIVVAKMPSVSKEFSPPAVAPGVASTLSLVIGNDNDADATLLADLVDNLPVQPAQMVVANPPNVTTSCPGGVGIVDADAGDTAVAVESETVVPAGGCMVTVEVVAPISGEYLNEVPVGALVTDFGTNLVPAEAPLKVSTLGYVSGKVFLDNQLYPDGQFLPGDSTPIVGNPIELRSGSQCSGALLESTLTDVSGNYLFSELIAGSYSVCQPIQPDGSLNGLVVAGTIETFGDSTGTPGTASNPINGSPTSQIVAIILNNSGEQDEVSGSPGNDFTEIAPVSITGSVYFDANDDGIFSVDENGIEGVTVTLSGPVDLAVITSPDGSYIFDNLPPGDYTVTETQPVDWTDGKDTAGSVDGVTRGNDSVSDIISEIILAPGENSTGNNFGENLSSVALGMNGTAACIQNAAYINYKLENYRGNDVTVELFSTGGRLVQRLLNQPSGGRLLWPGMVVDASGNGVGWPGWALNSGEWVQVADDRVPQLILRLSVNPAVEQTFDYPPATPACLTQPPETMPEPPEPPEPSLPPKSPTPPADILRDVGVPPHIVPVAPRAMLWILALLILVTGAYKTRSSGGFTTQ